MDSDLKVSHDHAVSIGMVIANRIAQNLGKQKKEVGDKIEATLKAFALPLFRDLRLSSLRNMPNMGQESHTDLLPYLKRDKKLRNGKIDFIIVPELGKTEVIPFTPDELIKLTK